MRWRNISQLIEWALILAILFVADTSNAKIQTQGARPIRIIGLGTCISSDTDRVSLHLRRIIVDKNSGLFTADETVGLVVKTTVSGVADDSAVESSFPRMFKTSVRQYRAGQITLPFEMKLLQDVPLIDVKTGASRNSIEVEFTLLKSTGAANFGVGLEQIAEVSKLLPPLPDPYSSGFKIFSSLANGILESSINEENRASNNIDAVLPEGKVALSFAASKAVCGEDNESSGTIALIKASGGREEDGYVDIGKIGNYCWQVSSNPFDIMFSLKPVSGKCTDTSEYHVLRNTYYALVLVGYPKSVKPSGAAAPVEDVEASKETGYEICALHDIPKTECY